MESIVKADLAYKPRLGYFFHVKTHHLLMNQNRNKENQIFPNSHWPMVSTSTVSRKWRTSLEFNSFHPLEITKERDQINAAGKGENRSHSCNNPQTVQPTKAEPPTAFPHSYNTGLRQQW
jgi:hypothetical protein